MNGGLFGIVARLVVAGVLTGGFIYLFPSLHWVIYALVFVGILFILFEKYGAAPAPSGAPPPTRGVENRGEGVVATHKEWEEEVLQKERARLEKELERKRLKEMAKEEVLRREYRAAWQRGEVNTWEEFLEKQGRRKGAAPPQKEAPF